MSCDFGGNDERESEREGETVREGGGKEKERKGKNNAHEVMYGLFINSCQS